MASTSLSSRDALAAEVQAERHTLLIDASLTGLTLLGLLAALTLPPLGVSGALLTVVYLITYFAGGSRAALEALGSLRRGKLDIDLLMVTAALAAAAVGQPRDGAFLLFLFSLANVLEHFAMGRTKRAVTSLLDLRPDSAERRLDDGSLERVLVEALAVGDTVLVRPGDSVPVDGKILEGESSIDQSSITGESLPVDRGIGDDVFAGTLNRHGALVVRVARPASDTTLARMIDLVTEAQAQRAPSQRFSDWFGQRYTVAVLLGSAAALLLFLLLGLPSSEAFYRTATLLVVASPCAVVISVPAAILSALAAAARQGVLFKGGGALEAFGKVSVLALDKTGTLTSGTLSVADVVPLGTSRTELLRLAYGIEQHSEHPIARSLVAAARAEGIEAEPLAEVQAHPGFGVTAKRDGIRVWAGNARFAERFGVEPDADTAAALDRFADEGKTPLLFGEGGALVGVVAVADAPRASAREALDRFADQGITRRVMLTGDHAGVARAVAARLGIADADVRAELLPDQKVEAVRALAAEGPVAFIGDGVNDAAALATADVGIAMGTIGSDAAIEAADVALLADDLRLLAEAHLLAQRANRIVRQNLAFALGIMLLMVIATLFGRLPLPLGVLGHEGGTLLVVANGLRLLLPARNRDAGGPGGRLQPSGAPA
jgi:heavy metal translocating P-type ATPase